MSETAMLPSPAAATAPRTVVEGIGGVGGSMSHSLV